MAKTHIAKLDNYIKWNFWHLKKVLGPVHLLPKTDKWDYLQSPIMKKKIVSCFDIREVPRSPGKGNWNWLYFLPSIFTFEQGEFGSILKKLNQITLPQLLYLCLTHIIWEERQMSNLVLNVKYLLFLPFLTAAKFYNLGYTECVELKLRWQFCVYTSRCIGIRI